MLDFPAAPINNQLVNGFKYQKWLVAPPDIYTECWRRHKAEILYKGSLNVNVAGGRQNFNLPTGYRSFEMRIDGLSFYPTVAQAYVHAWGIQTQSSHRWQALYTTMAAGGSAMFASTSSTADAQRGILLGASQHIAQADTSVSCIINIDPGDATTYGSVNIHSAQVWSGAQTFMLASGIHPVSTGRWSTLLVAGLTTGYGNSAITKGNVVLIGYE